MAVFALTGARINGADRDGNAAPSEWIRLYGLRTAVGYKDNVLLSPNPQGSVFAYGGADIMALHLPSAGPDTQLFLSAERNQFFGENVPDSENTVLGVGKATWKSGLQTRGVAASYLFQDQVLDVSATDPDFATLRVRLHEVSVKPLLRQEFSNRWFVEAEPTGRRQEFGGPLDDIWEGGLKLTTGRGYGSDSRFTVSGLAAHRFYDEKTQRALDGTSLADTELQMSRFFGEAGVDHDWDARRTWRSQARIAYLRNMDNGAGYFDYDRWTASLSARFKQGRWEGRAQVRYDYYLYRHQSVSSTDSSARRENETTVTVRAERRMTEAIRLFLQYDLVRSGSNRKGDEYVSQTVSSGAQWEF